MRSISTRLAIATAALALALVASCSAPPDTNDDGAETSAADLSRTQGSSRPVKLTAQDLALDGNYAGSSGTFIERGGRIESEVHDFGYNDVYNGKRWYTFPDSQWEFSVSDKQTVKIVVTNNPFELGKADESGIYPYVAVYSSDEDGYFNANQMPYAIAQATIDVRKPASRQVELSFTPPKTGLYKLVVGHGIPEHNVVTIAGNAFYRPHGFTLQLYGNSDEGFTYPSADELVINGKRGAACTFWNGGATVVTCQGARPVQCLYDRVASQTLVDQDRTKRSDCPEGVLPDGCRFDAPRGGVACINRAPTDRCIVVAGGNVLCGTPSP